jgi:hypothetical protein
MKANLITVVILVIILSLPTDFSMESKNISIKKEIYLPGDNIEIESNFLPENAYILTPVGAQKIEFEKRGEGYLAWYPLKKNVVLGNYTIFVDGIRKSFYVDSYSLEAEVTNGSIHGKVKYYVAMPEKVSYILLPKNITGEAEVREGKFTITLPPDTNSAVLKIDKAGLNISVPLKKPEHKKRKLNVGKLYFPGETVEIKANFMPEVAFISDPLGRDEELKFEKHKKAYIAKYNLSKDVILGEYTVFADGVVKKFVVDFYEINASYANGSIRGSISYYFKEPEKVYWRIADKEGEAKVSNGSFIIPLEFIPGNYSVFLSSGNARIELNFSTGKKLPGAIVSYDPMEREIIIKIERNITEKLAMPIAMTELKKEIKTYGKRKFLEIKLPATPKTLKNFGFPEEISNTSITVKRLKDDLIRVELNNKLEVWYRFKVEIPPGYRVKEIVGDDGRRIVNNLSINRLTGEVDGEIRWYVENSTLYFYDDPIWGYDISLVPPAPNNSLAIELAYDPKRNDRDNAGQISAVVFPYSLGDNTTVIAQNDHAGRKKDNFGNEIDENAGSKTAINFTLAGVSKQYGNDYFYWEYDPRRNKWKKKRVFLGIDGSYLEVTRTYVPINTVPDGNLESVVVTEFQTGLGEVNITQKVIIRDNNRWFAVVYYIKPVTGNLTNVIFYQGMEWNFNGNITGDNGYYNSTYDVVYGFDSDAPPGKISYGGFSSDILSFAHEVSNVTDVIYKNNRSILSTGLWGDISRSNLSNSSVYIGEAATALAWRTPSLNLNQRWVIPTIWGLGYNFSDMVAQISAGKTVLYDAGIKSIDHPENNSKFNPNTSMVVDFNATVALYGLVDVENLNVSINITKIGGGYTYENYTSVNLSVPFNETSTISFPVNISGWPYGSYNVTFRTNWAEDQNASNNLKWIIIHLVAFTVEPDQEKTGNAGEEVFHNITSNNYASAGKFEVNITASKKSWTTRLYNGSILVAEDADGDKSWDYIAPGYDTNSNGLPEIFLPTGTKNITISKVIPSSTPLAEVDHTTLNFTSLADPSISDDATIVTSTPYPPSRLKTFYLHGDSTLNTSFATSPAFTYIAPNSVVTWYQSPSFADEFITFGSIPISLWLNTTKNKPANHDIELTLYYTDGSNATLLGTSFNRVKLFPTPTLRTFYINLTSQIQIPKNNYLVLYVGNKNKKDAMYVFHSASYTSNLTLNTTTYVEVVEITQDKTSYAPGDTATVYANITDPIGSYDIAGANITIYYPNGTLYIINDSMNLNSTDPSVPSLWKIFNYSFYLPVKGKYTIVVEGIESNGVTANLSNNLSAFVYISGKVFEDLGKLATPYNSTEDRGISNATLAIFRDDGDGIFNPSLDTLIKTTTTSDTGDYTFAVGRGIYFIAVDSKTVNTTRGLNPGYTIGDIWAEQTFQVEWNGSAFVNLQKFGGQNASISDDWATGVYEHVAMVNASAYANESIDFGFSFDIVVNTRDGDDDLSSNRSVQGSLRQFILNSNAISGVQESLFRIPTSDSGYVVEYVNSTPIEVWRISLAGELPQIVDDAVLNASTQEGNTTTIAGKVVGVDRYNIPDYATPMVEVNGSSDIFVVNSSRATITGFSLYTPAYASSVVKIVGNNSFAEIRDNFIGTYANGSKAAEGYYGISVGNYYDSGLHDVNLSASILHNIIAHFQAYAVVVNNGNQANATVEECWIHSNGGASAVSDGISLHTDGNKIIHNYIENNRNNGSVVRIDGGAGVEVVVWTNPSYVNNEILNNTISENSRWGVALLGPYARGVVKYNVIRENKVGVVVSDLAIATIGGNSIFNNTRTGIDLDITLNPDGDGVTLNDGLLNASQPNYGIDYPVITKAYLNGSELYVEGFIGNESEGASSAFGGALVEIYLVKNSTDGDNLTGNNYSVSGELSQNYGEGWLYLGTLTADTDGKFNGRISVAGKGVGSRAILTATATLTNYGSSEFGRNYRIELYPRNISTSIALSGLNATINVTAFGETQHGVYVYWLAPENITIASMSGDYDSYAVNGSIHRWGFDVINAGETKQVLLGLTASGSFSLSEAYRIGVDPE